MGQHRWLSRDTFWSLVIFAGLLAVWEFSVRYFEVPSFVAPAPSQVLKALVDGLSRSLTSTDGFYLPAAYTLLESLAGFLIGSLSGIVVGTLVAQSRFLERLLFPYVLALQCLPKVAIAPLLVVWFGTGLTSKIVIVSTLTFFPLLVNSIAGFESFNADQVDLMRSFRATSWQIFQKIKFPNALPFIFAGLNMAVVYSLIGALVGEFLGAKRGLGVTILQLNFSMDVAGVFAVFVVLAVLGMALYYLLRWVEGRVAFWTKRTDPLVGM